jgi:hypothetical protein
MILLVCLTRASNAEAAAISKGKRIAAWADLFQTGIDLYEEATTPV